MKSSVSLKQLSFYLADLGCTEDLTWLKAGYVVTLPEKNDIHFLVKNTNVLLNTYEHELPERAFVFDLHYH